MGKSLHRGSLGQSVRRQLLLAPEIVAISGTTAKSTALAAGDYYLKTTADCYVRQGPRATITAATTDYLLTTNEEWVVRVTETGVDDGIAAITTAETGSLYIKGVGSL